MVGNSSRTKFATVFNRRNKKQNIAATIETFNASVGFQINQAATTCVGTLAAGAKCKIGVIFTPTTTGQRTGSLTIIDNAENVPQTVGLVGTGKQPKPVK